MSVIDFDRQTKRIKDRLDSALSGFELFEDRFSPDRLVEIGLKKCQEKRLETVKEIGQLIDVTSQATDFESPAFEE